MWSKLTLPDFALRTDEREVAAVAHGVGIGRQRDVFTCTHRHNVDVGYVYFKSRRAIYVL